jgi:excisionase family DNA binding protein
MNKRAAAEYLGISTRALEYYYTGGRSELSVRKVRGQTGEVADFDEGELRKLKAKIDAKRAPRPAVVREDSDQIESHEAESRSLARLSDVAPIRDLALALKSLSEGLQTPAKANAQVPVADKIILTLPEASALTNLSRNHLRQAIEDKKLKARIIGRGWRVKRDDLDAYVKKL